MQVLKLTAASDDLTWVDFLISFFAVVIPVCLQVFFTMLKFSLAPGKGE